MICDARDGVRPVPVRRAPAVELNGGCWVELARRPPCFDIQAEVTKGRRWERTMPSPRRRSSAADDALTPSMKVDQGSDWDDVEDRLNREAASAFGIPTTLLPRLLTGLMDWSSGNKRPK